MFFFFLSRDAFQIGRLGRIDAAPYKLNIRAFNRVVYFDLTKAVQFCSPREVDRRGGGLSDPHSSFFFGGGETSREKQVKPLTLLNGDFFIRTSESEKNWMTEDETDMREFNPNEQD